MATFFVFVSVPTPALAEEPATWGNVSGRILTSKGLPLSEARIRLVGGIGVPVDDSGGFLLSGIPLDNWDGDSLDLDISGPRGDMRISRLWVRPGSILAPRLEVVYAPGTTSEASTWLVAPSDPANPATLARSAFRTAAVADRIYATREGLVGFTTANGHTIQLSDHFAALPSKRALNRSDAASDLEFEVEVVNGVNTIRLPVWDVGPWNTKDDWWNVEKFRQAIPDSTKGPLPQGIPEAQAAFLEGYNQGLDGSERMVKNPAGVDLADGAFWNDLALADNGYVQVRPLWRLDAEVGASVRVGHWAKVRSTPGGPVVDTVQCGEAGRVLAGPDSATVASHWYLFYRVRWNNGAVGWSAENFLSTDNLAPCSEDVVPSNRPPFARISGRTLLLTPTGSEPVEVVVGDATGRILGRSGPLRGATRWNLPGSTGIQFIEVRSGTLRQILTRSP
jgi:hypothetical protein